MNLLVFTAYHRHTYFRRTVNTWKKVRGRQAWPTHVFLEPSATEERMASLADELGAQVHHNEHRRGVLANPYHALDYAFTTRHATFTVLAEDDVIVSTDTLEYFTWASEHFATNTDVLAVNAFTAQTQGEPDTVRLGTHFSPLVWGTWADRWTTLLRPTWDLDYSTGNADNTPSGWDWNINLRVRGTRHIITPEQSRADHIGEHHGTHMQPADFPASQAPTFQAQRPPCDYRLPIEQP